MPAGLKPLPTRVMTRQILVAYPCRCWFVSWRTVATGPTIAYVEPPHQRQHVPPNFILLYFHALRGVIVRGNKMWREFCMGHITDVILDIR